MALTPSISLGSRVSGRLIDCGVSCSDRRGWGAKLELLCHECRVVGQEEDRPGSVNPPLFVVVIVIASAFAGVYVKVAEVFEPERLTLAGVNVPPAPASLGVIVTVDESV